MFGLVYYNNSDDIDWNVHIMYFFLAPCMALDLLDGI